MLQANNHSYRKMLGNDIMQKNQYIVTLVYVKHINAGYAQFCIIFDRTSITIITKLAWGEVSQLAKAQHLVKFQLPNKEKNLLVCIVIYFRPILILHIHKHSRGTRYIIITYTCILLIFKVFLLKIGIYVHYFEHFAIYFYYCLILIIYNYKFYDSLTSNNMYILLCLKCLSLNRQTALVMTCCL